MSLFRNKGIGVKIPIKSTPLSRPSRIEIPSARSISAPAVITPAAPSILNAPATPAMLDNLTNAGPVGIAEPMPLPEIPQKSLDPTAPIPTPPKAPMLVTINEYDEFEDDYPDTAGFEYEDDDIFEEHASFFGKKKRKKIGRGLNKVAKIAVPVYGTYSAIRKKKSRKKNNRRSNPLPSNGESVEDYVMPKQLPVNDWPEEDNTDFQDDFFPEEDYGFAGGMTEDEEDFLGKKNLKKFGKGIGKAGKKIGKAAKKFGTFAAKVGVSAMGADPSLVDGKRQQEEYGYEAAPAGLTGYPMQKNNTVLYVAIGALVLIVVLLKRK